MSNLKVSRPTIYILVAAIAVGGWFLTSEDAARKGRTVKRAPTAVALNLPEGFDESDLKTKFEPEVTSIRDAFKPVVERRRSGSETALAPNAVPSILTGGDPNWIYTGMAEIDGKPTGLLENKVSGEAEFVEQSQQWKDAQITAISPYSLVLIGTNGKSYTLMIGVDSDSRPMMAQGFMPMSPNLRGNIGNGLEVAPERPIRRNNQGIAATQNGNGSNDVQND